MRPTVLLLLLLGAVKLGEGRGRIDLLAQLTNRRAGASLLGRIRPSRPGSPREQARALQQGSDVNQLASSGNPPKLNPTPRPARQSLLERARSRPRRPFLPTKPTRAPFTPRRPSPRQSGPRVSNRRPPPATATNKLENRLRGGECDALRTENDLLKQLISSVTSQKPSDLLLQKQEQKLSPLRALHQLQGKLQGRALSPLSPLDVLEPRALQPSIEEEVIEKTVTKTSVFPSLITSQTTREISLRFQNKWKTTQVVEAVIVTSTITELVESVVRLTPTRSLASLATATLRLPLPRQVQPTPASREGSPLSSFQALQRYLLQLREKGKPEERLVEPRKQEEVAKTTERPTQGPIRPHQTHFSPTRPHLKLPPKSLPLPPPKNLIKTPDEETEEVLKSSATTAPTATESVVTIFLSGSVPGVYSTVLSTITATTSPTPVRRRREAKVVSGGHLGIAPTPAQHLDATPATLVDHLSILPSPVEWQCKAAPVTVTVTELHACDGSITLRTGGNDSDSDIE